MNNISIIRYFTLFTLKYVLILKNTLANPNSFPFDPENYDPEDDDTEAIEFDYTEAECRDALQYVGGFNLNGTGVEALHHSYLTWSKRTFDDFKNNPENMNHLLHKNIYIVKIYTCQLHFNGIQNNRNINGLNINKPNDWCCNEEIFHAITPQEKQNCLNELNHYNNNLRKAISYGFQHFSNNDPTLTGYNKEYYLYISRKITEMNLPRVPDPLSFCANGNCTSDEDDVRDRDVESDDDEENQYDVHYDYMD